MSIADTRLVLRSSEAVTPRRWVAVVLALLLTPGLGFLWLSRPRLALRWFLFAPVLIAVLVTVYILDFDYLKNLPYGFVYAMLVNVAGTLHLASLPPRQPGAMRLRWYSNFLALFSLPPLLAMLAYGVLTVAPAFRMPSPAMEPTLTTGKPFLVFLAAYRLMEPKRGDVVLYRSMSDLGEISRVSRIIGLPGDMVAMRNGVPVLNGVPLTRDRLADYPLREGARVSDVPCFLERLPEGTGYAVLEQMPGGAGRFDNHPAYRVPEGSYFVMGDNRDSARDSRDMLGVGFVPRDHLLGKAIALKLSPETGARWREWWSAVGL